MEDAGFKAEHFARGATALLALSLVAFPVLNGFGGSAIISNAQLLGWLGILMIALVLTSYWLLFRASRIGIPEKALKLGRGLAVAAFLLYFFYPVAALVYNGVFGIS